MISSAAAGPPAGVLRLGASVVLEARGGMRQELGGKAALVLAWVALEGQAERRRLAVVLWPESAPGQGRSNLRVLVHRINQRWGTELLAGTDALTLDVSQVRVELHDTEAVLAALCAGGAPRCELLAGLDREAGDELQTWLDAARQRLKRVQLAGLSQALDKALAAAQFRRAEALARACVQLEPLSEHWHRQLMDTLARCGDRAGALAAFEDCKTRLRQHLGVLPDTQTRTVQLRLLQGQAQQGSGPASVATGLTPLGGAARFALVERESVLIEAQTALTAGQHVVLQGEAGVGKTRLLRHLTQILAREGDVEQLALRPGARDEPYAALAQLLQQVQPRRAPVIGMPEQGELARLAPLAFPEVPPSQAGLSAPRLHAALRHWAGRLADAGLRHLVLDDLHHADAASQAAFGALLAPTEEAPALPLLLAHRTGEIDAALAETLVAARVRGHASSITLQRLSLRGVQSLLQAMQAMPPGQDEAHAQRLLQRTGGNPLFVIELAQHTLDRPGEAAPATGNLDALLRSRLAGCSSMAQQLASVAGVAGDDFSVELAVAIAAQPALALMPAWNELQQRGLFADHGLAHELVRDAVLGSLPKAIVHTLHRQVATYLEAQGQKGARVLAHWLAAEDFDHALPHAVRQLHATIAAGLSTLRLELALLDLLGRLSDATLLAHLWLSTEVDGGYRIELLMPAHWPALARLVERVEHLDPADATADWLSFERARLLYFRDRRPAQAYALLNAAAERMPDRGFARAQVEVFLGAMAHHLSGSVQLHAARLGAAVAGLPRCVEHFRLFGNLDVLSSRGFGFVGMLRTKLAALRAARLRNEPGAVDVARHQIAHLCTTRGLVRSSCRYHRIESRAAQRDAGPPTDRVYFSFVALNAGRFTQALHFLEDVNDAGNLTLGATVGTFVWLRLGQWSRAAARAQDIDPRQFEGGLIYLHVYAVARLHLDLGTGADPLPTLRALVARSLELGVTGINRQLMEWEVATLADSPRERMARGERLLQDMRANPASALRLSRVLLELAEAHAQAGSPGCRALALEAARELRRGRTIAALYLPEGLLRCARLLQRTDPAEAEALLHVARRWVHEALPHVPEAARPSFVSEVPVNRLLLAAPSPR